MTTIPECPICCKPVTLPTTLNRKNPYSGQYTKCSFSQRNPCCFFCVRKMMNGKKQFKCLANCCTLRSSDGWKVYGEVGRNADDVAEPSMWSAMGSNGVTVCHRCNKDCGSVYELGLHTHKSCPQRKIKCKRCKKLVIANTMHEHNRVCFTQCKFCDEKIYDVTTSVGVTVKHYCKKKPISKCNFCSGFITLSNIGEHAKCSAVTDVNDQTYSKTKSRPRDREGYTSDGFEIVS